MKKIALDLDGVVFDSENLFRVYSEMFDVDVLKGNNLIDNSLRRAQERYNWNEKEFNDFMKLYNEKVILSSNIMPGADIVLKKLSKYYELVIITARTDEEIELSKKILEEIGLGNVKIINNDHEKINSLLKEKCNFIIEDNEKVCENAYINGINAIYFKNAASTIKLRNEIKTVSNWGEIYKYFFLK